MKVRSFIAIEIPEKLKKAILEIQNQLKQVDVAVKWVNPQNMHLTLKFLGNISFDQVEEIKKVLKGVGKRIKSFEVEILGIGVFPNFQYPRVVWMGVSRGGAELIKLQEEIDLKLVGCGFKLEGRDFTPHLTLGRVKSLKQKGNLIRMIHNFKEIKIGHLLAKNIRLMRSDLHPTGPVYSVLQKVKLGDKNSKFKAQSVKL